MIRQKLCKLSFMDESEIKVQFRWELFKIIYLFVKFDFSCFVPWQVLIALKWLKVEVRICSVFTDDSDLTRISPLTDTISYSFTHVHVF